MGKRKTPCQTGAGLDLAPLRLCLDFVNTEGRVRNDPPDRLETPGLFLEWAEGAGLLQPEGALARGGLLSDPVLFERFQEQARDHREVLYRVFAATTAGREPEPRDLEELNRELACALARVGLSVRDGRGAWVLEPPEQLTDLLAPIALSAADLLQSDQLIRVKECHSETCSWMFLDESRNRSRRWCDMADCGNRAKARSYYRRQRQNQNQER